VFRIIDPAKRKDAKNISVAAKSVR